MWFRRLIFTGSSSIESISIKKGQTVCFSLFTTNLRMANFEQNLADGYNHFIIPCDTSNKGLSPFTFVSDETAILYFQPDSDSAAILTVMVLDA